MLLRLARLLGNIFVSPGKIFNIKLLVFGFLDGEQHNLF